TGVLEPVGTHFVGKAKPAAFLVKIENDAAALLFQPRKRQPQLIAAIAAPRAEDVAGETSRMHPHRHRLLEIWFSDNDRDRAAADRVTEDHEPRRQPAVERDIGIGG